MSYSENDKTYGRKVVKRKNRRKQFVTYFILLLIGLLFGLVLASGITHIVCCTTVKAEVITHNDVEGIVLDEPVSEEPEVQQTSLGEYKLTAYCACEKCCGKTDGITASGVRAKEGVTVAADTSVLPFGTKIFIDGHEYTVQDRGGAIKGNKIDVYFDHHQEALEFGVQYKEIFKGV